MFIFAQEVVRENEVILLDVQVLNLVVGLLVPLLVGIVAKVDAPSGLKAVLNLGLSAVAGAVTTAIAADGAVHLREWVIGIVMTWLTSIVSYHGLWKPTEVAPNVQYKTRNFGVGKPRRHHSDSVPVKSTQEEGHHHLGSVSAESIQEGSVTADKITGEEN